MELGFDIHGISVVGVNLPLPEELYLEFQSHLPEALLKASDSRKIDFIAGRICAFLAAKKLGRDLHELHPSADRSPLWPSSLRGSISHSKRIAVSCVALSENYRSIGIDAEELIANEVDIKSQVANERELQLIADRFQLGLTILFSAKEALYKAIYPLVKTYIDFKDVEITSIDFKNQTFEIRSLTDELISRNLIMFSGSYQIKDRTVITLVTLLEVGTAYAYP